MKKLLPLILLSGCAYVYEPDVSNKDVAYDNILSACRDEAQPSLVESVTWGVSPIAGGAHYPQSVPERIDNCLKRHGYDAV